MTERDLVRTVIEAHGTERANSGLDTNILAGVAFRGHRSAFRSEKALLLSPKLFLSF
jgi:hypothetical protein